MNLSATTASLAGTPVAGSRLAALQQEVSRGGAALRFNDPALEADYLRDRASGCAAQARGGLLLSMLLTLAFQLLDRFVLGMHYPPPVTQMLVAVLTPLYVVAWLAMRSQPCKPWVVPINIATLVAAGLTFAWVTPQMVITADRPPYAGEALLLHVAILYFLSGAMFHAATAVALGMSLAFVVSIALSPVDTAVVVYCSFFLVATNLVFAIGRYMLDKTYRRNYLTRMIAVELGERDALTGLYNRRVFEERLELLLRQAQREGLSLTLLMLDFDHFKRINDHGGHALGDRALRTLAQALQDSARRPLDTVGRVGGDEFAAVWVGLPSHEIDTHLAELNQHFAARSDALTTLLGAPVTLSLGVAQVPAAGGHTADSLLRAADEALYRAKAAGRARAEVVTLPPT